MAAEISATTVVGDIQDEAKMNLKGVATVDKVKDTMNQHIYAR